MTKERILTPKFKRNQKVIVVNGFERDNQGVVKDVRYGRILDNYEDIMNMKSENEYEVYLGFFKGSQWIRESYLEAL